MLCRASRLEMSSRMSSCRRVVMVMADHVGVVCVNACFKVQLMLDDAVVVEYAAVMQC